MKDKNQLKFISIQSKVSVQTANRIDVIVKRCGFESRYELMQYLLSAFLKVADPEGEKDENSSELYEFAKIFEGFENRKTRIITTKPSGNRALRMTDSINIFSEEGKKGYVCRKISIDGEGMHTTNSNERAVCTLLKKLYPEITEKIMSVGRSMNESSYMRVIECLLDEEQTKMSENEAEIVRECVSNAGGIVYGNTPKRGRKRAIKE